MRGIAAQPQEQTVDSVTVAVRGDGPQVSIVLVRAVHKGDDAVFTIQLDSAKEADITIPIDIAEIEETVSKDFIAAEDEGRKMVAVPAGATRVAYRIPTGLLDDGDRTVVGRVTISLVPSQDDAYTIGSPVSIDIVDARCGHAADADADDDGLIEICDLEDLDAMRYQLDGSGYRASRTAPLFNAGCDEDGDQGNVCRGYELTRSLDFEDTGSYISGSINRAWSEGLGWQPIGGALEAFSGYFEANGYEIINLYINRPVDNVGLIRNTAPSALINDLILSKVNIRGKSQVSALVAVNEGIVSNIDLLNGKIVGIGDNIGGLIGRNKGTVFKSNVIIDTLTGGITELRCRSDLTSSDCADEEKSPIVTVRGNAVGSLIGNNDGNLVDNFASAEVLGRSRVGGLVGIHSGGISNNNEAGGNVRGNEYVGGLIGYSVGAISGSKSIADVDVTIDGSYAGGLVGYSEAAIGNSTADGVEVSGGSYIGGLIGYSKVAISDTTVSNIEVSGSIYAGGLVGYSEAAIGNSTVDGVEVSGGSYIGGLIGYSKVAISDSTASDAEVSGETYVGGLVGAIETGNILRGNANGSITGNSYIGGLIGKAEGIQIINSTASFSISATGNDAENIGGIAGAIEAGSILASKASGEVSGEAAKVGGLVGSASGNAQITQSYASGTVQGSYDIGGLIGNASGNARITQSYASSTVQGSYDIGGLIGSASGNAQITQSYASGTVQGSHDIGGLVGSASGNARITQSYASGAVRGSYDIGGLVGSIAQNEIAESYASGAVTGTAHSIGGLVGKAESAMIIKSYALNPSVQGADKVGGLIGIKTGGMVLNSYARSSVQGVNRVGGLIGENDGPIAFTYAAAAVSASGIDMGGLIGYNHASHSRIVMDNEIANSHWDTTASGTDVSDAGSGFANLNMPTAPGATASDAFYQWSENDWDFGHSTEYPVLKDSKAQILPQQTVQLSSLTVGDGLTLIPAFNPNVFDYYIEVNNSLSSVSLAITASDNNAMFSVSSSANNNVIIIKGSGTAAIGLDTNLSFTDLIIARSYNVQLIHPLEITINMDPVDRRLSEGQTARLTVENNIADTILLSYTWTQSNPDTSLLMEGMDTGITVQDPNFSIPIAIDLVPPSVIEFPITLNVKVVDDSNSLSKTQSMTLTAIKVNDGIDTIALVALEFIGNTLVLWAPNIAEVIAADPDGEADDADKNIRYQWQYALPGETSWTDIANANNASIDLNDYSLLGYVQYRQRVRYIDAQGYEESLVSEALMPIVDKDQDGLIDLYYLEDLNAIRNNLRGEGYQSTPGAVALTGGCPNATCRGYELHRDLDFLDNASYRDPSANRFAWTVDDFSDNADTGWISIGGSFSGIFDGNGHTISNLQSNTNFRDVGLFKQIKSATIRDINLSNAKMQSNRTEDLPAGILATWSRNPSKIIGVSVSGEIINTNGKAGGLIGHSESTQIINSRAQVHVKGLTTSGLVGDFTFSSLVINSYATGTVEGGSVAGGLVGTAWHSDYTTRIINSYADVDVLTSDGSAAYGGLVGGLNTNSQVINSYAAGSVTANNNVSGLVGRLRHTSQVNQIVIRNSYSIADLRNSSGTVNGLVSRTNVSDSYWDTIASGQLSSEAGIGKLTGQMQAGAAQSTDPNGVYYNWSKDAWDFGTATQYPALKYVQHPDPNAEAICDAEGLPKCGTLLTPHLLYGLEDFSLIGAELSPPFSGGDYTGNGEVTDAAANAVRLLLTAYDPDVRIDIYDSDGKTLLQANLASGTPSQEFIFSAAMPMQHFVIEIKGTEMARQSITLNRVLNTGDNYIEINNLEDLNAIRSNQSSDYRLARDLDFLDDASYRDPSTNKSNWTVGDFNSGSNNGWLPISRFEGTFDGNGYTIANLQINRDSTQYVGLFSVTGRSSLIHDIGLLNVAIEGGRGTGSLIGAKSGRLRNSFATGKVTGKGSGEVGGLVGDNRGNIVNSISSVNVTDDSGSDTGGLVGIHNEGAITGSSANGNVTGISTVGGLVGENTAQVINSSARGLVTATGDDIGGLVGRNTGAGSRIINSYATGAVSGSGYVGGLTGSNEGKVINSYATGDVASKGSRVGGLVAENVMDTSEIINSYATGIVSSEGMPSRDRLGGLAGYTANNSKVINSYAIGTVTGAGDDGIGNLIGWYPGNATDIARDITHSYWNSDTAVQNRSSGGSGQTTAQLQMPTGATGIYSQWSANNWDFGTATQYPILKYAANPGGVKSCDGEGLPDCGSVISPELRYDRLNARKVQVEAIGAALSPAFDSDKGDYIGTVTKSGHNVHNNIQLRITAPYLNDRIDIYVGSDEVPLIKDLASGEISKDILLVPGNNFIIVEIRPASGVALPFRYKLNLIRRDPAKIECLEELDAIRNNLSGNYQLARDLDFDDDDSYCDPTTNKSTWTTGGAWTPIGDNDGNLDCSGATDSKCFTGNFNGNGYTISNLKINRTAWDYAGLFGAAEGGVIGNLD